MARLPLTWPKRLLLAALLAQPSQALAAPLPCSALHQAAAQAASALRLRVDGAGRFTYAETASGEPLPGYNLVRHAGALYALAGQPGAAEDPALHRAAIWLARQQRPLADWPGAAAIWSDAEGHPQRAKLGASGLALAAFADLHRQGLAVQPLADLQALGRFLVQMQDDAGRFHMRYVEGQGAQRRHSLYYPGEAALGLYRLSTLDGDARWASAADRALAQLGRERLRQQRWPPDHWALIAASQPAAAPLEPRHLRGLLRALLAEARADGALTADGRSTPTATRLEGLLAAAVPASQTSAGLSWLLAHQRPDGSLAAGGSGPRASEHRIDYTQHALSAFAAGLRLGHCQ